MRKSIASEQIARAILILRGRHRKYLPYVFTEHGAIMAATILTMVEFRGFRRTTTTIQQE